MEEWLAVAGKSARSIRHNTTALGGADLTAQVGLSGLAEFALLALRCAGHRVRRDMLDGKKGLTKEQQRGLLA